MGLLSGVFVNFFNRKQSRQHDGRSGFIFYKIVDSFSYGLDEYYKIQCINTKATFDSKISEIVFDIDILYNLHPVQACYIGIEYGRFLKKNSGSEYSKNPKDENINNYSMSRYGIYSLQFQDRKGNINFINKFSGESLLMDPRDIALSKELIEEFDSSQSFYIGLLAGMKLGTPIKEKILEKTTPTKHSHLRLVKK